MEIPMAIGEQQHQFLKDIIMSWISHNQNDDDDIGYGKLRWICMLDPKKMSNEPFTMTQKPQNQRLLFER